ncbi:putative transferase CAF17 homolog, mitochondrial isoform X2 [Pristis pectinata]|uniref:putative transferase CAF17 homolog, mitochondrial isoform X2 n=1 Tax=Pristis pectinata TaxID=685728 RepID=UPI00223DE7D1|nr:putative transferase CAF17 homolog, mitochondrial isoform X2 [Pristis pectinata]
MPAVAGRWAFYCGCKRPLASSLARGRRIVGQAARQAVRQAVATAATASPTGSCCGCGAGTPAPSSRAWSPTTWRMWLHASQEEPTMLIECDATLLDDIQKHLKIYKIRRKVDISLCPDLFVWAVLPSEQSIDASSDLEASGKKVLVCTRDPRTDAMGWRLVLSKIDSPLDVIPESRLGDIQDYHRHRYKIGIAEGVKDLPSGEAIPLESNLVYMNGISFTKGCYIGQELTARTHYTGVIRKRLMPIQLDNSLPPGNVPEKAQIITESGKLAGRFRNYEGDVGLALIRLAYANEPLHVLTTGDVRVWLRASMPNWWPKDEKNK